MKIGLISPYDWSYPGGVKTHIERLSAELRLRGHKVRILTAASGPQGQETEYGIYKMGRTAALRFNGSVARVAINPDLTGGVRRIFSHENYDIIHLHEPFVSTLTLAALKIAEEFDYPTIATFHASSSRRSSKAAWAYAVASPFLQASFRRLDNYIAVSDAAYEHVVRNFPAEYHIVPNGIDLDLFHNGIDPIAHYQDGKRTVLFLSRMEPRKGLRYLIKAIPLIRKNCREMGLPPVRFILAGDGPERVQWERWVQRQGWEDVIFTGYIKDEEKVAYFRTADVYCAPSTGNESQGITLLEAMAASIPVVASDIAGYRTVITNEEDGLLTPPCNAERLAWGICHLLRDDTLRSSLGAKGRERATQYSWKRVTTSIESIYEESQNVHQERATFLHHQASHRPEVPIVTPVASQIVGISDTSG